MTRIHSKRTSIKKIKYRFIFENENKLKQCLEIIKEIYERTHETCQELEKLNRELEKSKELSDSCGFEN